MYPLYVYIDIYIIIYTSKNLWKEIPRAVTSRKMNKNQKNVHSLIIDHCLV